jgi:hypothetical protein
VTETLEGTAVDDPQLPLDEPIAPAADVDVEFVGMGKSTELGLRPTREALTPIDPEQVVASMAAYQALLPRLLEHSDFQDAGGGKKFVKRSGWRKIARAFNLSLVLIDRRVERDPGGNAIRAEAVYRAIAPNGQCQDGDGYCSIDEPRFADAKGRQKIENDLRATATTRAKSRAIADLVGMGDVSAEEIDAATAPIAEASEELRQIARNALGYLLDGDVSAADELVERLLAEFDDRFPVVAGQTIVLAATAIKQHREARAREAGAA